MDYNSTIPVTSPSTAQVGQLVVTDAVSTQTIWKLSLRKKTAGAVTIGGYFSCSKVAGKSSAIKHTVQADMNILQKIRRGESRMAHGAASNAIEIASMRGIGG